MRYNSWVWMVLGKTQIMVHLGKVTSYALWKVVTTKFASRGWPKSVHPKTVIKKFKSINLVDFNFLLYLCPINFKRNARLHFKYVQMLLLSSSEYQSGRQRFLDKNAVAFKDP